MSDLVALVGTTCSLLNPPTRRKHAGDTLFLILAQPGLAGLPEDRTTQIVYEMAEHDQDIGNGIHPMNRQTQHLDTHNHTPEVACQHRQIQQRRGRQPEDERRRGVEEGQADGESDEVARNGAVPGRIAEGLAVEDGSLGAVDEHGPEGELADDFVHGAFANQVFLRDVGEAVTGGGQQREEVAFDWVDSLAA